MCALRISLVFGLVWLSGFDVARAELRVSPREVRLDRPEASQQILVTEFVGDRQRDVTREAKVEWQPTPSATAISSTDGLIRPVADGESFFLVKHGSEEVRVPVIVTGMQTPPPVSFQFEVLPLLTKARCNSGGCHGKAEGQNGFKLSLFGFDAESDHDALLKEGKGRRVLLIDPERSMLIQKGTAQVPHGGGLKIERNSPAHQRLRRWIAEGALFAVSDERGGVSPPVITSNTEKTGGLTPPRSPNSERQIVSIEVEPAEVVLTANGTQQLRVTAIDDAGGRRCATIESDFISNAGHVVEVNSRGLMQASDIPGEAAILVRYLGHVAVCRAAMPQAKGKVEGRIENNFIDKLTWDKWQRLNIPPSDLADDATFLRRVFLDVIGTLPTAAEARAFLADTAADKRAKLVDALLQRPEYAEYWAMKWTDLLRADKIKITPQGTVGVTRWLRKQFAANRPYDEMVREILTAQGPVQSESPVAFFKSLDQPELASRAVSQLFLGVRIECAQCHHHPSERWSQDDYAGLAGFFTGLAVKKLPEGTEAVVAKLGTDSKHPRTNELVPARALGAKPADFTNVTDRRQVLATWLTSPDNAFFAKAITNRLWSHYFGRGLVEPIDDIRATNPATNEPLLAALEAHLREVRFDLKAFTKTLLTSRAYQLSGVANDTNKDDRQHFSHMRPKAMPAEVLLDAISQTTGVPEKFNGWPEGVRSIQVWDNRMPSYFFRIFGRPVRATVCECERSNEPSISQALHLLNSPEVNAKLTHRHGLVRKLAESSLPNDQITDEIYLSTLSRLPTAAERSLMLTAFESAGANRQQAVEDILWSVLNTKEFLYNQ